MDIIKGAEALTGDAAMFEHYANKAIDRGDHDAFCYWARLWRRASSGKPYVIGWIE